MKRFSLHESKNYKDFNFISSNRDINDKKVKEIEKSILKYGLMAPILINKIGEIIDGQHRFIALRRLKLPIYYVVCNYYNSEEQIVKLQESTRWKALDYCKSLAERGNLDCKRAIEIAKEYNEETEGKIGEIQTLELLLAGPGFAITSKLKKGEYTIDEEPAAQVLEAIQIIAEHPTSSSPYGPKFSRSLKKMYYKYNGLDLDIIDKIANRNFLKSFTNEGDQFEYLSNLYEKENKNLDK